MQNKRVEIDALNTLFCLFVVFIHLASAAITGLTKGSVQLFVIYLPWRGMHFVVQGFLFLSALKLFYKISQGKEVKYFPFVKGRFIDIYLPYAAWAMAYYLYFISIGYFGFSIKDYLGYLLLGNIAAPFYFIVLIMQFYLLLPMWKIAVRKIPASVLLVFSAAITLFVPTFGYSDRVFTNYLLYWMAGCVAGMYFDSFIRFVQKFRWWLVGVFLVLGSLDIGLSYSGFVSGETFRYLEQIHIFYTLSAILGLYCLALYIKGLPKLFAYINRSSFQIYLFHCLIIFVLNNALPRIGVSSVGSTFILKFVIVYSAVVIFSFVYSKIKMPRQAGAK